jgi:hypothetical protein
MLRMIVAGVLIGHGLIHLLGVTAYLKLAEVPGLPYKTTLLHGRWALGDTGMRVFGVLWLVPAIGFVSAAIIRLAGESRWALPLAIASTLSLVLTALDWDKAFAGIILNAVILVMIWLRVSV